MAYDAWGGSWGASWGVAWTGEHQPPVPPIPDIGIAGYTVGSDRYFESDRHMDRKWEREKARKDELRKIVLEAFREEVKEAIEEGENPPTKTEIVEEAQKLVDYAGLRATLDAIRSEVGRVMKAHADELEKVRRLKKQQDEEDEIMQIAWMLH